MDEEQLEEEETEESVYLIITLEPETECVLSIEELP
jgi:hypothetical protein